MKYLNLGCGYHYAKHEVWTNLDFTSTGEHVIGHNLLNGIPFDDHSFDVVYHSHVLEHFSKSDAVTFLKECYRVLKPDAIIRIAIPDLEQIARLYLKYLDLGIANANDEQIRANYDWLLIEMYDQTVRNYSGGEMGKYLFQDHIINEDFVYERIGEEGRMLRASAKTPKIRTKRKITLQKIINRILRELRILFSRKKNKYEEIGHFRSSGEIHQWMYDRYSLTYILKQLGFKDITVKNAFESEIPNWPQYELDAKDKIVRKPDSLFIEGRKK